MQKSSNLRTFIAWALYDFANGAFNVIIATFIFATYFVQEVAPTKNEGVALWGMMLSIIGVIMAASGPILGAMADHTGHRKKWIAVFASICVTSTALLWFVKPSPDYMMFGLILAALGMTGSELSFIYYNAMLPELADNESIGRWSGWGWGAGYVGGVLSLILCMLAFVHENNPWISLDKSSAQDVRATFLLTALWFIVFAAPLFLFTPAETNTRISFKKAVSLGFQQTIDLVKQARTFGPTLLFLVARMIYTDGLITLFAFGGVYAAAAFQMTEEQILLFGIALNISAGIGALSFAHIDDKIGGKLMIIASLIFLIVLSFLGLMADEAWKFWICGCLMGLFVGPVQASSRSYLARVAPPHLRNQMFGFFALSGRATSFLGPFLVGAITYETGSLRLGMSTILAFYLVGMLLMLKVPNDKENKSHNFPKTV